MIVACEIQYNTWYHLYEYRFLSRLFLIHRLKIRKVYSKWTLKYKSHCQGCGTISPCWSAHCTMGSFQKVFKRLIFLACLFFVLWQCYFSLKKFLQKPRSTSVQVDYSKKWPMPNFILCPVLKEDVLEDCNIKLYVFT